MGNALPSDNLIFQQFKVGEPGTFGQIYNSYVAELLDYAPHRLSSLEEAWDMVQDIFLNLYERRTQLQIMVSLRTYLFSALKYKIIDHIRKNVRREYYADLLMCLPEKTEDSIFNNLVYNDIRSGR